MLLEVKGDLPCYCDTLRTTGDGYSRKIVLLSLFGPRNAVRAAWAKLSKSASRSGYRESIDVGGQHVAKSNDSYSSVAAPLERGILHQIIFHHLLGHNAPDAGFLYQTGPDADQRYFDRLARLCPVPLRSSWREPLWALGREHGAIALLEGHGREVWQVATTGEVWQPIIRDAVVTGGLR